MSLDHKQEKRLGERRVIDRRQKERREGDRRVMERRQGDRRSGDRRKETQMPVSGVNSERRGIERRQGERRQLERRRGVRRRAERRGGERRTIKRRLTGEGARMSKLAQFLSTEEMDCLARLYEDLIQEEEEPDVDPVRPLISPTKAGRL